jgi:hypothetical protein
MMETESKQERALRQFEKLRPEIIKLFLGAPDYGISGMTLHFYNREVTRIIFNFEESIIPLENETLSVGTRKN